MPLSIKEFLKRGLATSKEIQITTGLNQKAVSRQIKKMGDEVIRLKQGRTYLYTITRDAFGGNDMLPLFMVDMHGNTEIVAFVRPLANGNFFVTEMTGLPRPLLGAHKNGLYSDLPYFLSDLAPQGFIGRQIAKEMASQSEDFPSDPRKWNSGHIGSYLLSNGDDLPGNFKFGNQAGLRRRQKPTIVSRNDYPKLAHEAINGEVGGSSAGGEQPKFTAYCGECSAHVIVKFSPKGNSEMARRWRDVLITEFYATKILHSINLPAAETNLIEREGRLFLESIRFDRSGMYGRNSMLSLELIDAEFVGSGGSWPQVTDALYKEGLIGLFHSNDVRLLWAFGKLINNTDMHLGNISLSLEGSVFRLCPIYDMCSMGFSPISNGDVAPFNFKSPVIDTILKNKEQLRRVTNGAYKFWEEVKNDERISSEFREYLSLKNPLKKLSL